MDNQYNSLIFTIFEKGDSYQLSIIFLSIEYLDTLTLYTFFAYAVGSFLTKVISDIVGRRPLFLISSLFLFVSSVVTYFNIWIDLISANLCIGL